MIRSAVCLLLAAGVFTLAAQVPAQVAMSSDELAIRLAIVQLDRGDVDLRTDDSILFSGAYVRPVIRGESRVEPTARARSVVPGSSRTETRVQRIEIAASRDMAYEFSDGTVSRREKQPSGREQPSSFDNSTLRVWKKVDGRWLVAAHFSAPHGAPP
jgi:hypothetical protein